jgi:uncharacterized phiE125 gp8 family phage protein
MSGLKVIAAPTEEPISIEQARLHLRLDVNDDSPPTNPDDSLLEAQIPAAREWCEGWAERAFAAQTLELALDAFPSGAIALPRSPVISVESVKYLDTAGDEQTLPAEEYALDNYAEPALLAPAYGATWPAARTAINSVRVRYLAGFTTGDSPDEAPLPFAVRAAMLLVLGHLYENRENSAQVKLEDIPLGARALLLPYRLRLSMA